MDRITRLRLRVVWSMLLFLILAAAGGGLYLLPSLPARVPIHFNWAGEPDGYSSPLFGVLFFPGLALVALGVISLVPRLDRLAGQRQAFYRTSLPILEVLAVIFLLCPEAFILLRGFGHARSVNPVALVGPLMMGMAALMPAAPRNAAFGIRTVWAMTDDEVWHKSQVAGAWTFGGAGAVATLGFFFPRLAILLLFVPLIGAAAVSTWLSYRYYKARTGRGGSEPRLTPPGGS